MCVCAISLICLSLLYIVATLSALRSLLLWDVTQHRLVVSYQCFRLVSWLHLQEPTFTP
jgi:hypothetical protein